VVSIMSGLRHGQSGVRTLARGGDLSLFQNIQTSFGAHLTSYSMTTGAPFPDVKRSGCEAKHEVKSEWSYAPNPFMISWYIWRHLYLYI